jgi:hypothetical protein
MSRGDVTAAVRNTPSCSRNANPPIRPAAASTKKRHRDLGQKQWSDPLSPLPLLTAQSGDPQRRPVALYEALTLALLRRLTKEQKGNYVLASFSKEVVMFRAFVEEAAALTSLALFVGMIAIWAQVLTSL